MALRLTNLGCAPSGALPTAKHTAQCGRILTGEVQCPTVDFVANCVSRYALDEYGARDRASRSTKHFQEIHGAVQHREGSPALLLARWPTALSIGCIPPITASMVFHKTIVPAQAAGGRRWIAKAWAVEVRR